MKKPLLIFFSFLLFVPSVLAATVASDFSIDLDQNESKEMAPITITSTLANDVTAIHGIRLLLETEDQILWQKSGILLSGSAVSTGKVDANASLIQYSKDYKSVFIPVKKNFEVNDILKITGLKLKAYEDSFNDRYIGLDLNGDFIAEVKDINSYEVTGDSINDKTPPYPIVDLKYVINADKSITLNWNLPPDYDYNSTIINRTRVEGDFSMPSTVYNDYQTVFIDTDLKNATSVSYSIVTADLKGNWSEPVVLDLDLTTPSGEPEIPVTPPLNPPQTPETPTIPETPSDEALQKEITQLNTLLNYYHVRYKIACMSNGLSVHPDKELCLWAKIDLVYAQELTGTELESNISLSENDLSLMSIRRKNPETRYKTYCEEALTPATYCASLAKGIKRISYFLD